MSFGLSLKVGEVGEENVFFSRRFYKKNLEINIYIFYKYILYIINIYLLSVLYFEIKW